MGRVGRNSPQEKGAIFGRGSGPLRSTVTVNSATMAEYLHSQYMPTKTLAFGNIHVDFITRYGFAFTRNLQFEDCPNTALTQEKNASAHV